MGDNVDLSAIDAKVLKATVNDLNKILGAKGKIKLVGAKKVDICNAFKAKVEEYIDNDTTDDLPESVVDFYNNNFAEEEQEQEEPQAKGKGKGGGKAAAEKTTTRRGKGSTKTTGKGTGRGSSKPAGKGAGKAERAAKGEGVVASAVACWYEDGLRTAGDITAALEKRFPGRPIKSTIQQTVCILNHVSKFTD